MSKVCWVQVEPRRRYRAQLGGRVYHLIYQGRDAIGPDLDVGWYLEGGADGKGHQFMHRRLQEAAHKAIEVLRVAGRKGGVG